MVKRSKTLWKSCDMCYYYALVDFSNRVLLPQLLQQLRQQLLQQNRAEIPCSVLLSVLLSDYFFI